MLVTSAALADLATSASRRLNFPRNFQKVNFTKLPKEWEWLMSSALLENHSIIDVSVLIGVQSLSVGSPKKTSRSIELLRPFIPAKLTKGNPTLLAGFPTMTKVYQNSLFFHYIWNEPFSRGGEGDCRSIFSGLKLAPLGKGTKTQRAI